jgi:hypothetical protein
MFGNYNITHAVDTVSLSTVGNKVERKTKHERERKAESTGLKEMEEERIIKNKIMI